MPRLPLLAVLFAASLAASAASAQTRSGALAAGDGTLTSGEYMDEFPVQVRRGQTVRALVTSPDFNTYVILKDASGRQEDNDDCETGDTGRSCAEFTADTAGTVRVLVTSSRPGETGTYRVVIETGASGGRDAGVAAAGATAATRLQSARPVRGTLAASDATIPSGEYVDWYTVEVRAGRRLAVDVASDAFGVYVMLVPPTGEQQDSDACASGETGHACLDALVDESGPWRIGVTSASAGETGRYTVTATVGSGSQGSTRGM